MACGSRGCALRAALSRVLPPGLAEALELRHAGHIRTCPPHLGCTIRLQGKHSSQSTFFAVIEKRQW